MQCRVGLSLPVRSSDSSPRHARLPGSSPVAVCASGVGTSQQRVCRGFSPLFPDEGDAGTLCAGNALTDVNPSLSAWCVVSSSVLAAVTPPGEGLWPLTLLSHAAKLGNKFRPGKKFCGFFVNSRAEPIYIPDMAKIDTVNKYIDEYLAGRSPEAAERFRAKDVSRQYQSIMTWRYNQRKRAAAASCAAPAAEETPKSPAEMLRAVRRDMERRRDLTEEMLDELTAELDGFAEFVRQTRHRMRVAEIEMLETRREEIAERLKTLRRQVDEVQAPTLF